jgi:hypothetical protein
MQEAKVTNLYCWIWVGKRGGEGAGKWQELEMMKLHSDILSEKQK